MKVKNIVLVVALFLLISLVPETVSAQCSMCRAVLESDVDQSAAEGINDGILYLMVFPYVLIGGIAYFIYRSLRSKKKAPSSELE